MLSSARTRNLKRTINPLNTQRSKSNKDAGMIKIKQKILVISEEELKLRESIGAKYGRSKIKGYQYGVGSRQGMRNRRSWEWSEDSFEMAEYENLIGQRFINLREYHNQFGELPKKKYLFRLKYLSNRKLEAPKQQNIPNIPPTPKCITQSSYQENSLSLRERIFTKKMGLELKEENHRGNFDSGERGKEWTGRGYGREKRASSQQEEVKFRLLFFRKEKKIRI